MRFSHFLKYNAVPEWQNHYMDYNDLKNMIYTLQTDELKSETGAVLDDTVSNNDEKFNNLAKRFKDAFKRGRANSTKNDAVMVETVELHDLNENEDVKKKNSLKKIRGKFFDSRSSSISSEKTLFNTYDSFVNSLTDEKLKVDDFYKRMESKFYEKFESLIQDLEKEGVSPRRSIIDTNDKNTISSTTNASVNVSESNHTEEIAIEGDEDDEDDYVDYDEFADTPENTALLNYSEFNVKSQKKSILKQSITNLYIDLAQLKSFIELNKMGFSKICKKADKVLRLNIKAELIETGEFYKDCYIFQKDTFTILSNKISKLIEFYAIITDHASNITIAKDELKSSLHDHIVWERSNSWKDMLGLVSRDDAIATDLDMNDHNLLGKLQLEYFIYPLPFTINFGFTKYNNLYIPKLFFGWQAFKIAFIILCTGILLGVKTFNDPAQHRCMALVECVAFLWASEALPLHITAFLVPLLVVLFRVLKNDDGTIMQASTASSTILGDMWTSTIVILLAGFTLGEVLAQYNIAKVVASWLLAGAGTKPRNVLLVAMAVVFFLSMWISNVAAPVLTYSLLQPLLEPLESDSPLGQALILGVAIAANVGGMSSPISSPQNIISMDYLSPYGIGWGQFFAVALPTGIIATFFCWILLCLTFKIHTTKIEKFVPIRTKFTLKQYFIIFVTILTIILWCVESKLQSKFGSSGQIAIIPIVVFFGTGLLSTKDFNSFPWSIVLLAMGGTALGSAVSSSGLLATIARALEQKVEQDSVLAVLCIFGVLMLVVGTFVSHTVSAIIIIPLVQEVGDKLSDPKAAPILVFGCALLASAGMGLASSGFPNVTAISMVDKKGDRYLDMLKFILRGVPCSLIVFVCVITIGYGIMSSILHGVST
ncbi:hypothetical protein KAFR_0F01550 [Kazachstania africana CBS 2517]|uniref:SPX domain-containing protein n=1 Tax=Kazachstania africana (strain ATCC 22294 / BCRC 22015 / CBS 2517 / CECT 1963 / NBRC 1671 / NRRL Y-8276) TaxID=1071382 RepID=H2AWK2_KAZAF|nr:hypothetical protein KAFR_0F01550 [Kazachstania africana CBS 2517]CCF58752.1 hypothetical protein KAFR_0F01550 [Kazachstania africana CBS 2517]